MWEPSVIIRGEASVRKETLFDDTHRYSGSRKVAVDVRSIIRASRERSILRSPANSYDVTFGFSKCFRILQDIAWFERKNSASCRYVGSE